jgi:hypothetical protein
MATLIPEETIEALREKYEREHPAPETPAEALCRVARANPDASLADLSFAAERSEAWVRKTLKAAGIVLVKPQRQRRMKVKPSTTCAHCGHPRGSDRARSFHRPAHCVTGTRHGHWSNPAAYNCTAAHCLVCDCPEFVPQ